MSRFGWAYANSSITGAVANGPTNSVQFNSGSQVLTGSSNFTFDPATNKVTLLGQLTGSTLVISASVISASTYLGIAGGGASPSGPELSLQFKTGSSFGGSPNLTFDYTANTLYLTGTLRADNLVVSSSQILKSGSTIFGDDISDTHQFTGSIYVSGNGYFTNQVTISNNGLIVSGATIVSGGNLQVLGATISSSNGLQTAANLEVAGTSTLNNKLTITTNGLTVTGSTIITGSNFQVLGGTVSSSNALQTAGNLQVAGHSTITTISGTTAEFTTLTSSNIVTQQISLTGALLMSGTSYISEVDYIDFDVSASIPAYKGARLYYDLNTTDLAYYGSVANQQIQIGQQTVVKVKNSTGSPISKGKLVRITGGVGDNPLISTASWENDSNSANTLGMLMSTVAHNDFGYVLLNGILTGVNTDPAIFTAGQVIYLSSSGDYTATTPIAPKHTVRIGEVVRAHATVGSIFVKIDNGYEIDELHNVLITSASAGDLIVYNSSSALWQNTKNLTGSYTITGSLSASSNIQAGGTLTIAGVTTLSGNTDIYAITQVRNNPLNMVSSSTVVSSLDQNGNISGSGQLQIGTNITLGNNLTMNGALFTSAGEIRVKNQIIKTTDAAGTTTKAYLDNNGDVSGSRNFIVGSNITAGGSYLGSGGIKGGYTTYSSSFTVPSASYFVGISSTGSVITASLDSATQYQAGQTMYFKDIGGAAGTNNILIKPSGSQTIDGVSGGVVIANNSGSLTLVSNGSNQFYIVGIV